MVKRFIFSFFFLSLCFQIFILTVNAGDINTQKTITRNIQLDIPLLNQMDHPKLYNGCEVTSLAMILNYKGIMVTKNTLADKIAKVPITYHNGKSGNPHFGFVGNMEDGPGLGVYHEPIFSLAKQYVGDRVEDLTNQDFDLIHKKVAEENPIWVITTSTFAPVSNIQIWHTPQGSVNITYNMHSVVITGIDDDHIFINDPYGNKNKPVDRESFIKAWEQMGKQAILIN
ncbi:MAG TPA: C39 family peptidase [Bacillus sp. (in: firmicutes)]|jgi:uncharacterized protein YvpB